MAAPAQGAKCASSNSLRGIRERAATLVPRARLSPLTGDRDII